MGCTCRRPRQASDPRHAGSCNVCGKLIPTGIPDEEKAQLHRFYDEMARRLFPGEPPIEFESLRRECERRHAEGLDRFGYAPDAWRDRDNMAEGVSEESDGLNYIAFDSFQHGGVEGDPEIALAFEEARFLFLAYECNRKRAARRAGSP